MERVGVMSSNEKGLSRGQVRSGVVGASAQAPASHPRPPWAPERRGGSHASEGTALEDGDASSRLLDARHPFVIAVCTPCRSFSIHVTATRSLRSPHG